MEACQVFSWYLWFSPPWSWLLTMPLSSIIRCQSQSTLQIPFSHIWGSHLECGRSHYPPCGKSVFPYGPRQNGYPLTWQARSRLPQTTRCPGSCSSESWIGQNHILFCSFNQSSSCAFVSLPCSHAEQCQFFDEFAKIWTVHLSSYCHLSWIFRDRFYS